MHIIVNPELEAYIDPLTRDEYLALERSILAEGCRNALVLWGEVLVDGHNRYEICSMHSLPFQAMQSTRFQSMEDVHLWMIDQHLGRRSLSDFQRGVRKQPFRADAASVNDCFRLGAVGQAGASRCRRLPIPAIERLARRAIAIGRKLTSGSAAARCVDIRHAC